MRRKSRLRILPGPPVIAAAILLSLAPLGSASAYTEKTLHSFCTESSCSYGNMPLAGPPRDGTGALYGAIEFGGKYGNGLVLKLIPNADKTKYTKHILKNFRAKPNGPDGDFPEGDLITDIDNNLYGTAAGGAKYCDGAVFTTRPLAVGAKRFCTLSATGTIAATAAFLRWTSLTMPAISSARLPTLAHIAKAERCSSRRRNRSEKIIPHFR